MEESPKEVDRPVIKPPEEVPTALQPSTTTTTLAPPPPPPPEESQPIEPASKSEPDNSIKPLPKLTEELARPPQPSSPVSPPMQLPRDAATPTRDEPVIDMTVTKSPSPIEEVSTPTTPPPPPTVPETLLPTPIPVLSSDTKLPLKTKKRRKKKPKDAAAPKHPHTGYIRYMNERREEYRQLRPNAKAIDITKLIGEEWMAMEDEKKKPYLEAAEVDRQRYNKELEKYKEGMSDRNLKWSTKTVVPLSPAAATESVIETLPPTPVVDVPKINVNPVVVLNQVPLNGITASPERPPQVNGNTNSVVCVPKQPIPRTGDYDVPIFTEEFLEHNKTVDAELRMLRKSNTDYELQNSVLEKHVENMRNGIDKAETESNALKRSNDMMQCYIDKLRLKLSNAFGALSIPTEPNAATMQNIDKYMADLHSMATSNSHGPASLNKAKDIIRKLDLQHI